jgi:hypothetical protein
VPPRELGGVTIVQTLLGARVTAAVPFYVHEFSGISSVLREPEAPAVDAVPVDALFQTDMLFVRQDSPIIASKRWK